MVEQPPTSYAVFVFVVAVVVVVVFVVVVVVVVVVILIVGHNLYYAFRAQAWVALSMLVACPAVQT